MAFGVLGSAIFADIFGTAAMRAVFSEEAFLGRCVEVEAALARAQGRLGIIPADAADAISRAASALASGQAALDLARLKRETETVGYPILPLVRQLAQLAGDASRYLLEDPTFKNDAWVTANALETEASGYFLVPPGKLPRGWRSVDKAEAETVWGRGFVPNPPDPPGPCDGNTDPCQPCPQGAAGGPLGGSAGMAAA